LLINFLLNQDEALENALQEYGLC